MAAPARLQLARRAGAKPPLAPPAARQGTEGGAPARAPERQGLQTPATQLGVRPLQTEKALQAGLAPQ